MKYPNPTAEAAYRRALDRAGVPIKVQRISGSAPNLVYFEAPVTAVDRDVIDDSASVARSGYSASAVGAITQSKRSFVVLASDLRAKRFPLPVQKNDVIVVEATSEELTILDVDAQKRAIAGAIELTATGVQ